ncbi:plastin-3-like [Mya arenaria]|uniref:plastin-3-like n=1 Tax=Mya arenaria TaxID=6604 RepID=UPI0022DF3E89|nr:plastin-3-like [Mya arenaria]
MAGRASVFLEQDQIDELREQFDSLDADGNGTIELEEIGRALELAGLKIPQYKVRKIIDDFDKNKDGKIDMNEFRTLYSKLKKETDVSHIFKKSVSSRTDVQQHTGSSDGITHSVKDSERYAFADWINRNLSSDPDCEALLPIDPDSDDLYTKTKDGILLCKLINQSVPDTIDERTINKKKPNVYQRTENHNLALNSARSIGCNVVNIGHGDLENGTPHLVLGLLWQVIRIGLLSEINLASYPGLVLLLEEGETIDDLMKLSPEEILIRWVNYHLRNSPETNKQIANFSGDIKDSEAYVFLLKQISPREAGVDSTPMMEPDGEMRAEAMLKEADKIKCRAFITSKDVVKGNSKLNLAFVANLFNTYPALDKPDDMEIELIEETREEKTYRNWMNSMGVSYVNRLYNDLQDGLVIFQLYDIIQPGSVDWKRVIKTFNKLKAKFEKIGNCNYAVELGKKLKFSLVGIDGNDIHDGNQTLTLALVWQLMRAYTLAILTKMSDDGKPIDDSIIVNWANSRLRESGKSVSFSTFKDQSLSDSMAILHLIDCIAPKKINWDYVKDSGSEEDKMANAKYAISMGRKIGARIYALPEDVVEVKSKMVMTIFACLMAVGWKKDHNDD